MKYRHGFFWGVALLCSAFFGCDSEDTTSGSGGTTTSGGGGGNVGGSGGAGGVTGCGEPVDVPCSDDVILQLNLKPTPAPGLISNEQDGTGWISHIDATAGGFSTTDPHSYVYGKFADNGLEKVAVSDEDSLDSMDWDVAFRRYVARINSGNSGPSCVQAAQLVGSQAFDDVTMVPAGLTFGSDLYFTEDCTMIEDGTGMPGSAATALSAYWTYAGCVSMSDTVFVLSLADGRHVKLLVTHYYDHTTGAQDECDTTGSVTQQPSGSATIRMRWAFVQ